MSRFFCTLPYLQLLLIVLILHQASCILDPDCLSHLACPSSWYHRITLIFIIILLVMMLVNAGDDATSLHKYLAACHTSLQMNRSISQNTHHPLLYLPSSPSDHPLFSSSSSVGEFTAGTCVFECTQAAAKAPVYVDMLT